MLEVRIWRGSISDGRVSSEISFRGDGGESELANHGCRTKAQLQSLAKWVIKSTSHYLTLALRFVNSVVGGLEASRDSFLNGVFYAGYPGVMTPNMLGLSKRGLQSLYVRPQGFYPRTLLSNPWAGYGKVHHI